MKVKELKELIESMSDDAEIYFELADGCCSNYILLDVAEALSYSNMDGTVRFKAIAGYRSCIQSSKTKKADEEYWTRNKIKESL